MQLHATLHTRSLNLGSLCLWQRLKTFKRKTVTSHWCNRQFWKHRATCSPADKEVEEETCWGSLYITRVVINVTGHSNEALVHIQVSHSDNVFLWNAVSVFSHSITVTRSCQTTILQQKTSRCHQKHSTSAGHIVSSYWPRKLLASWTGCCIFDVMLCNLLPLTNFPTD